jgi:hypothetical protein
MVLEGHVTSLEGHVTRGRGSMSWDGEVAAFVSAYNGRWPTRNDKSSLAAHRRPQRANHPLSVRSARWRYSREHGSLLLARTADPDPATP